VDAGPPLASRVRDSHELAGRLVGTPHGVGHAHLPADLDEVTFRFHRRRTPRAAFQTLRGLASDVSWAYDEPLLQLAGLGERDPVERAVADDHVIVKADVQELRAVGQLPGEPPWPSPGSRRAFPRVT